jgi:ERCC4-type nuclease
MIYIDISETRTSSNMPHIENAIPVDNLEALSGADFMISNLKMPPTNKALIQMHLTKGHALLVQRKQGHDLASSIGERLNTSLTKMRSLGARQAQCVLLFIGTLNMNQEGNAIINGQEAHAKYWSIQGAVSKWHDRGGVVEFLPRVRLLEAWMQLKEQHVKEYAKSPIKRVYHEPPILAQNSENALQIPVIVNDGRNLLATIPGIGETTAQSLWDEFKGDLSLIICWLCNPESDTNRVHGVGPKTIEKCREFFDFGQRWRFNLELFEEGE